MEPLTEAEDREVRDLSGRIQEFFKRANKEYCGRPGRCGLCCRSCAAALGHFTHASIKARERSREWFDQRNGSDILACQIQVLKELYGWDREAGFLAAAGCRLPGHTRSVICLESTCHYIEPLFVKSNMNEFRGWVDRIRQIRRAHGMIE